MTATITGRPYWYVTRNVIASGRRKAVPVHIVVPDVNDVRADGWDRIQIFRSTTRDGAYTEITDASTRLTLTENGTQYEYEDETGTSESWYKIRYSDSTDVLDPSPFSDAVQYDTDPALSVLPVQELKETEMFAIVIQTTRGQEISEAAYKRMIIAAVDYVETRTDLPIRPRLHRQTLSERQDFYSIEFQPYVTVRLNHYPVLAVHSFNMTLPVQEKVFEFPPEWWHLRHMSGRLDVIPGAGNASLTLLSQAGTWLPFIRGWNSYIPQTFRIAYVAGFPDGVPPMIVRTIAKVASIGLLHIAGDLVNGPGVAAKQVSIDNVMTRLETTQSATNAGFGARVTNYKEEIESDIVAIRSRYKGARMVVA